MPPPSNPKLVALYEAAMRLRIARVRMEKAEQVARTWDAILLAFRKWRKDVKGESCGPTCPDE